MEHRTTRTAANNRNRDIISLFVVKLDWWALPLRILIYMEICVTFAL